MKTCILQGQNWQRIKKDRFPNKPNNYIKNTFYTMLRKMNTEDQ